MGQSGHGGRCHQSAVLGSRLSRMCRPTIGAPPIGILHFPSDGAPISPASPRTSPGVAIAETNLLTTLVIALAAAGVGALLAVSLRQPVVVGYIIAGLAIGPYTPGIEASTLAVEDLADSGVILLLFVIGAAAILSAMW